MQNALGMAWDVTMEYKIESPQEPVMSPLPNDAICHPLLIKISLNIMFHSLPSHPQVMFSWITFLSTPLHLFNWQSLLVILIPFPGIQIIIIQDTSFYVRDNNLQCLNSRNTEYFEPTNELAAKNVTWRQPAEWSDLKFPSWQASDRHLHISFHWPQISVIARGSQ